MALDLFRPYPGVALLTTERGSVLLGAPTDAFKATKALCQAHNLAFPRVLVAPQRLLCGGHPQFNPEFFLYDFLFVYGAAFKPELEGERLQLCVDEAQVEEQRQALRITLVGPTRAEMEAYRDAGGRPTMTAAEIDRLARVAEHMAIKKAGRSRTVDEMVEFSTFDQQGRVDLLDGQLVLVRESPTSFRARHAGRELQVDLAFTPPVRPFAELPAPSLVQTPETFGVKPIGTRSGFDLSGPTTGFVIWLNGRAIVYDGPVGTRYLLERQGISLTDVGAVILSHCHEDHMGAFVELILSGHRPMVLTAEPIYRSALAKLAGVFQQPPEEIARLIDYHPVRPGEPIELYGGRLDFFYTVHAIPTVGLAVSLRHGGAEHRVQISGDTMHHDGLDEMRKAGVIDDPVHRELRALVPTSKDDNALFFADVGEAIIHGHPKDWQDNPNRVLYYHCPDNEHTRSFGHPIAVPGHNETLVEAPRLHASVPVRLLAALAAFDLDPGQLATFLHTGRARRVEANAVLGRAGEPSTTFTVVTSGSASVQRGGDQPAGILRPGEFFGHRELVDPERRLSATIVALTPMELFELDGALVDQLLGAPSPDEQTALWRRRASLAAAPLLAHLDLPTRHALAQAAHEERHLAGDTILTQGQLADDFFLLIDGEVEITATGQPVATLKAGDADRYFGITAALFAAQPQRVTVRALTPTTTLRLPGRTMRALTAGDMGLRLTLSEALRQRSRPAA